MSACHCLSVQLGGKYDKCEYHDWKAAQATRALARRHQRNVERHIRRRLENTPTPHMNDLRGKKARLARRWHGQDRFWRSKAMAEARINPPEMETNGINS
jgi:hypothetical protein